MIYFFYGTDREKIQHKARATFEALQKKKPDASYVEFDAESLKIADLEMIAGTQGLFEKKLVVKLGGVLENEELEEKILKSLPALKASENIIVWSEGKVGKAELEKIKKNSEKVEAFDKKENKKEKPNIFALSDALAYRDRKKLWQLLLAELDSGTAPEAIHGTLFWKIKTLLLAEKGGFGRGKFSKAELQKMISDFVDMYHKAHRGEVDFEIAMEKFALSI